MNDYSIGSEGTTTKGPRQCVIPGQSAAVRIVGKRGGRVKVQDGCGFSWWINATEFRGDTRADRAA